MSLFGVILVRNFRIRTEYGEIPSISPYSVQMRENADQNNSEYGHFSRSVLLNFNTFNFLWELNRLLYQKVYSRSKRFFPTII